MQEYTLRSEHATTIALDQHARSVTLAALDLSTGETRSGRLADCPSAGLVVDWAKWATEPLRFVYESGPCGFQLAREIRAMGIDCDIIAVTSIPRSTEDKRLKDDRRDAQSLLEAVTAPSSKCKAVHIPSEESEAARDLCRAYYDMVLATKRLKMQFSAMLLRHGFVWNERTPKGNLRLTWTKEYIKWARSIRLPADAENQTLKFYLKGVLDGLDRCNEIRRKCLELSENERFKPYVDALTRLKGVDRMGALTFVATMDDFSRFKRFLAFQERAQRVQVLRAHAHEARQRREDRQERQDIEGRRHHRAKGRGRGAGEPAELQQGAEVAAQGLRGRRRRRGGGVPVQLP